MERWREEAPVAVPLLSLAGQEAITDPRADQVICERTFGLFEEKKTMIVSKKDDKCINMKTITITRSFNNENIIHNDIDYKTNWNNKKEYRKQGSTKASNAFQ